MKIKVPVRTSQGFKTVGFAMARAALLQSIDSMYFNLFYELYNYEGCWSCRALFLETQYFCRTCLEHLREIESEHLIHRNHNKFDAFSLWEWAPWREDLILRNLLTNAKARSDLSSLSPWVLSFLRKRLLFSNLNFENIEFVVPPSQRGQNHSLSLAKQFIEALQLQASHTPLVLTWPDEKRIKSEQRATKNLSLSEREKLKTTRYALPQFEKKVEVWIMIDDIFTSGTTAERVYQTLDSPRNFEVWTLASRSRLAT